MEVTTILRTQAEYPTQVTRMHIPPPALYCRGRPLASSMSRPRVAIVGSRRVTAYGRQVTRALARSLAEQGVVIISGLAIGVDAEAHAAALRAGGTTIAVLPSPVEAPVPLTNRRLALNILAGGGTLVSTYPAGSQNYRENFVARNELVAALSDAVIVTEAATRSGTLRTAAFAQDLSVPVFAVPGAITSPLSVGTHQLIKTNKAAILSSVDDVLQELHIAGSALKRPVAQSPEQQCLLDLLQQGIAEGEELFTQSNLSVQQFNQSLTLLEIEGKVLPLGANRWGLP